MRLRACDWSFPLMLSLAAIACGPDDPVSSTDLPTVAAVIPAAGSTGVDPNAPITIEFTHTMPMAAYMNVDLHEGDVSGPVVEGSWSWSADFRALTFTPAAALKSQTRYTVHIGGGLRDAMGRTLDYQHCTQTMGGQWAAGPTGGTGGMMGGRQNGHLSSGWTHANGSYGMVFTFMTA